MPAVTLPPRFNNCLSRAWHRCIRPCQVSHEAVWYSVCMVRLVHCRYAQLRVLGSCHAFRLRQLFVVPRIAII
jgi:hypothetical protein